MNRSISTILVVLSLLGSGVAMAGDKTVAVQSDDPEMLAAVAHARKTLSQFFDAFKNPQERQNSFLLKVAFTLGDQVEHIWLADLDLSGSKPRGVVANEPNIDGLHFKQVIEFNRGDITDWMYIDHGTLVGGFTTRLIRDRMTQEERKKLDAESPYRF